MRCDRSANGVFQERGHSWTPAEPEWGQARCSLSFANCHADHAINTQKAALRESTARCQRIRYWQIEETRSLEIFANMIDLSLGLFSSARHSGIPATSVVFMPRAFGPATPGWELCGRRV